MIEVIPALIPDSLDTVESKFKKVLGLARKVQIDFVDSMYAPPRSWPFNEGDWKSFSRVFTGQVPFPFMNDFWMEADLLLFRPEEVLPKFIPLGFKSFVLHIDTTHRMDECISLIRRVNKEVGLGIKPSVNTEKLDSFLNKVDFVQFMGNDKVGYNGVELDGKVIEKIRNFHGIHPKVPLQIDIGVSFETAPRLIEAGITRLVSGSAIFDSGVSPEEAIPKLLGTPDENVKI